MADTNISFANIVPNTTASSWSQAYNAGKLFAVLSLKNPTPQEGESINLAEVGKDAISTFEQEFFTLENKDLDSIKNAILAATEKIQKFEYSFVITYISGSVLYVFIAGGGSVILKRGSKIATILEAESTKSEVKSASGFLQNDDLIILQTKDFTRVISMQVLASSLDHQSPSSIAEILAPKIHERAEGAASAAVLLYKDEKVYESLSSITPETPKGDKSPSATSDIEAGLGPLGVVSTTAAPDNFEEISLDNLELNNTAAGVAGEPEEKPQTSSQVPKVDETPLPELVQNLEEETEEREAFTTQRKRGFSFPIRGSLSALNHRRRLLLTVAAVIIVVLAASIFLGIRNKNEKAAKQAFASVYPVAEQKYKEGQSLKDLNQSLAMDNFKEAQKILVDNQGKFKKGSKEREQIQSLLAKVNAELGGGPSTPSVSLKEVPNSSSDLLSVELNNTGVNYFTQDAKNVYFIDGAGIQQVAKPSGGKAQLVRKNWTQEAGLGVFGSNLYVLDKGDGAIYKFAPAASGSAYTKSTYVSGSFENGVGLAIDGAVYVLTKDGKVLKFLRSVTSPFTITGLTKPLSNPARIVTDSDFTNIYVLDNGNSRIVALDKNGKFISEYPATELKAAKDIDVQEANKKIFVLSGGRVYLLPLK